ITLNGVLYSSGQGLIHVWNLTTRRADRVLEGQSEASVIWLNTLHSIDTHIRGAVLSQTGSVGFCHCSLLKTGPVRWLLAHTGEGMEEVKIIDLPSKSPVSSLMPQAKLGRDMCIKLWQVRSNEYTVLFSHHAAVHHEPVMCLDFDPARQSAVSGFSEEGLSSWTLDRQHRLQVSEGDPGESWDLPAVYPGDSKIVVSAVWDLRVHAFGWMKLRSLAVLQHHSDMVLSLALLRPSGLQGPRHQHLVHNKPELRFRNRVNHWALCILWEPQLCD
uniref:Uncharacterized protein n=1 Tax=Salmo trutta TaxID=8032 RepID=A0A674F0T5_SALTR